MEKQDQESGQARYQRLKKEAESLDIETAGMNADKLEIAIAESKDVKGPTGISVQDAINIEAKLRFEEETREKIRAERRIVTETAELVAESESLNIPINLPESPTELDLAKARHKLGVKKKEEKPSPETLAIEASKRGYFVFNNLEQEDANHTFNLGGKYSIHLIAEQVHVLSDWHVKKLGQIAIRPVYKRVQTGVVGSEETVGRPVEECVRAGSKKRWSFERLGDAPQDAPFGLVTDVKILEKLTATV